MHFWRAVGELEPAVLMHVGLDGTILYVNSGVGRLLGYQPAELIGESMTLFMPTMLRSVHQRLFSDDASLARRTASHFAGIEHRPGCRQDLHWHERLRCTVSHKCGRSMPVELTVSEIRSEDGRRRGYLAFMLDWSEMFGMQEKLRRKETYDEQTGLLCLKGFQIAVASCLDRAIEAGGYSLIHLDIDHFSTLSFESSQVADNALRAFATWLQVRLQRYTDGAGALVCKHFNASEFVIFLADADGGQTMSLASTLREDFARINLATDLKPFHTTLSIGLATITDGVGLERGLSRAANACYLARARGGDRLVTAREKDLRIYRLGEQIREALLNQRFEVHAQKIVSIADDVPNAESGRLHFEVLCRLRDRAGNLVMPDRIIPAAESLGLAMSLDLCMIETTLELMARYPDAEQFLFRCSFNLSGVTLSNEKTHGAIGTLIARSGIPASKLCFEMTESAAIRDSRAAMENLRHLRQLGCRIAIDDFGSGYSNYQSLSNWPVDIIKIDGAYVRALMDNSLMRTDACGMIASARARGMEVVAEYADSPPIVAELKSLGVDFAQGYIYHRPEPLLDLLADQSGLILASHGNQLHQ